MKGTLMKTFVVLAVLAFAPDAVFAQGARLQLDRLDKLASIASDVTDISLPEGMLNIAGGMIPNQGKETLAAKQVLSNLKGVFVRSYEFDKDNAYSQDDVDAIRKQLSAPGWVRMVTVDEKKSRELTEVYMWMENGKSGGLAVVVAEPMELTIVNIVGPIDFSKLGALQGQFGIPKDIPSTPTPAPGK